MAGRRKTARSPGQGRRTVGSRFAKVRGGSLQRLSVDDPKVAALSLSKETDFRQALSRLCGSDVTVGCLKGSDSGCGTCPNCTAAAQLPRLRAPWTLGKLNQALVLSRRPTMSEGFYSSFFPPDATNTELLAAITQFRAYAMLRFGGFRPAYQRLSRLSEREIHDVFQDYNGEPEKLKAAFARRTHGQDLIDEAEILPEDRWYLGYISDRQLMRDLMKEEALRWRIEGSRPAPSPATARYRKDKGAARTYDKQVTTYYTDIRPANIKPWRPRIDAKRAELEALSADRATVVLTGERNSAAYLAASHIDVYVATSMREPWEYEAMGRVVQEIFSDPVLHDYKLTKFDPTLSFYESRYDKGLVEGLMLNRASVTIYMVQETDTLGKDSELAATLAYGRPVIAYVPRFTRAQLIKELERSRLRRTFTRLLMLLAENYIPPLDAELGLELMRRYSPMFVLDLGEERVFRDRHLPNLAKVHALVAEAEIASLDSRARTIAEIHPLGLQLQQGTGVACGILLARTPERCATLLAQLLTNELQLRIQEGNHATLLVECAEKGSEATYRVVTADPVLTNAFWAHYRV